MTRNFWNFIASKIRFGRFAFSTRVKLLTFGCIYSGNYSNWKHYPNPLFFCMYSGPKYSHALQIQAMSHTDKAWLGNLIYMIKKGGQRIDGLTLYKLLKMQRMNIVKVCYRVYFTNLLNVRMVSAGLTPLDKLIYTDHKNSWVHALNEKIRPSEIISGPKIAYYPEELRDRVNTAINAQPITAQRVGPSPYQKLAPWIKP